jgi:hypothetical protein
VTGLATGFCHKADMQCWQSVRTRWTFEPSPRDNHRMMLPHPSLVVKLSHPSVSMCSRSSAKRNHALSAATHRRSRCNSYTRGGKRSHLGDASMSDVYIYYFTEWYGSGADNMLSIRPATLATIKGRGGEPIMESQIVADHTELDADGFLMADDGTASCAVNALSAQIKSTELRAASRDSQALKMNDGAQSKDKYMLRLESRELRKEARKLNDRRTELTRTEFAELDRTELIIQ